MQAQNTEVLYRSAPPALLAPIDVETIPRCGYGNVYAVSRRIDEADRELKKLRGRFYLLPAAVLWGILVLVAARSFSWWLLISAAAAVRATLDVVRWVKLRRLRSLGQRELDRLYEYFDRGLVETERTIVSGVVEWNEVAELHNEAALRVFKNPREKRQPLPPETVEKMAKLRDEFAVEIDKLSGEVARRRGTSIPPWCDGRPSPRS